MDKKIKEAKEKQIYQSSMLPNRTINMLCYRFARS
jgi:hypothetical protein